jgi:hypothetical protein
MQIDIRKYRYALLLIILAAYAVGFFYSERWKGMLLGGDSNYYYLHVVSFWIHEDVGDYNTSIEALKKVYPQYIDPRNDIYGIRKTETGKMYIKYPVGVALLETPFFLVGHLVAALSPQYAEDGWSNPYLFCIACATIVYVLLGIGLLFSLLTRFFSHRIAFVVLLTVALATNLYYQSTFVAMSHGILFFLHSLLIWLTVRFYDHPDKGKALLLGATIGMITITRVPEIIVVLVPLLWGVYNRALLRERFRFIGRHSKLVWIALAGFAVIFSIQVLYWHYVSGKLFFNPYAGETLNLLKSHFVDGWFNFKNGWLIYTPVMAFSLLGWCFMRRHFPQALWPNIAFVLLQAYIHYAWYAWTYFPGFGSRPMVETYPLLSFALASFYVACTKTKLFRWVPVAILVVFAALNLFQTWQQMEGLIYSELGNKAFYVSSFGKTNFSRESLITFDSGEMQPDTQDLRLVYTEVNSFEDSTTLHRSDSIFLSGSHALYDDTEYPCGFVVPSAGIRPKDWIEAGIAGYIRLGDPAPPWDLMALLVVQFIDEKGQGRKWRQIKISKHQGNPNFSFWATGAPNVWGTASFFVEVPNNFNSQWTVKAFVWNPHHQKIHLDDAFVKHYTKR